MVPSFLQRSSLENGNGWRKGPNNHHALGVLKEVRSALKQSTGSSNAAGNDNYFHLRSPGRPAVSCAEASSRNVVLSASINSQLIQECAKYVKQKQPKVASSNRSLTTTTTTTVASPTSNSDHSSGFSCTSEGGTKKKRKFGPAKDSSAAATWYREGINSNNPTVKPGVPKNVTALELSVPMGNKVQMVYEHEAAVKVRAGVRGQSRLAFTMTAKDAVDAVEDANYAQDTNQTQQIQQFLDTASGFHRASSPPSHLALGTCVVVKESGCSVRVGSDVENSRCICMLEQGENMMYDQVVVLPEHEAEEESEEDGTPQIVKILETKRMRILLREDKLREYQSKRQERVELTVDEILASPGKCESPADGWFFGWISEAGRLEEDCEQIVVVLEEPHIIL